MKILYLNGEFAGRKVEIPPSGAAIGRETDNDIQLLVGGVSRYHAKLESREGLWYLRDLGSTNGTKHNGVLITQNVKLSNGDVFSVGDQIFRVEEIAPVPEPEKKTPPEPEKPASPAAPASGGDAEPAFVFRMPSADDTPEQPASASPEKTAKITNPEQDPVQAGAGAIPLEDLFGGEDKKKSSSDESPETAALRKKKLRSNILFYILVIMIAVLCVVLFWRFQNPSPEQQSGGARHAAVRGNPFFLFYEKQTVTKNNAVFQFKFLLENDHLAFSLDDLQSGRVYAPVIQDPIRPEAIENLKKTILETNFMSSVQQEKIEDAADRARNFSRIVTGFDDKFNDITVRDITLTSFTRVEEAISTFLYEEFGLDSSMVESRETLVRQARSAFDLAEKQYNSIQTQPGNLWRAIENYRIAMRRYEVFAEKPPEWAAARDRLKEAEEALEQVRKTGHHTVNMYYQQREFDKALQECSRLMEYFPPDSETYGKLREFKIKIEKIMKGNK